MSFITQLKRRFLTTRCFDDKSRIEFLHRFALRYIEGDKSVDIGFDSRGEKFLSTSRAIVAGSIKKWNYPFDNEFIDKEKKKEILDKVITYCKEKRIKYTIEN